MAGFISKEALIDRFVATYNDKEFWPGGVGFHVRYGKYKSDGRRVIS